MRWSVGMILFVLPAVAGADPEQGAIDLTYDGYASGFRVLTMQSELMFTSTDYRIVMTGQTAGIVGAMYHARWQSTASGTWADKDIDARHFESVGLFGSRCAAWNALVAAPETIRSIASRVGPNRSPHRAGGIIPISVDSLLPLTRLRYDNQIGGVAG
jgi:hypothetical protein